MLAFKAIPAALGVSVRRNLAINSLTVPRSPSEPAGAICKLVSESGAPLVINVEYNQLDALLRENGGRGDTADDSGYSPYPGNVNTLIFELGAYGRALEKTGGSMPEFVNPKYANEERTQFKKPTRLECMMQARRDRAEIARRDRAPRSRAEVARTLACIAGLPEAA